MRIYIRRVWRPASGLVLLTALAWPRPAAAQINIPIAARPSVGFPQRELGQPAPAPGNRVGAALPAHLNNPAEAPQRKIEASSFKGVTPGHSITRDVEASWGRPVRTAQNGDERQLTYSIPPFTSVMATVQNDVVRSIIVTLHKPFTAQGLAQNLEIEGFDPAVIPDDAGRPIGLAYPERGVLLSFGDPKQPQVVTQIILEPINASSFLLRAEARLAAGRLQDTLDDLRASVELEPENAHARWLHARTLLEAGQIGAAVTAAEKACSLAAENVEYRLTWIACLEKQGSYEQAAAEITAVYEAAEDGSLVKARAANHWATLLANGPDRDYKRAVELRLEAVKSADALVEDERIDIRRQSLEILLDANVGIAADVARGPFSRKAEAVGRWLDTAAGLAQEIGEQHGKLPERRFRVARGALAALTACDSENHDPKPWLSQLHDAGRAILSASTDAISLHRYEWEYATALYDAAQIYHRQKDQASSRDCAARAVKFFEASADQMREMPGAAYLRGRAYFRLGLTFALADDHAQAHKWFEKAAPLVAGAQPGSALSDPGTQGETLVSMAISFWAVNQRDDAVALTMKGLGLMERAVEDGTLEKPALSVPYTNLSVMHRKLGNIEQAERFRDLAGSYQANSGE